MNMYAGHFELEKYIHFNTEVVEVVQSDNFETTGQWSLQTRHLTTGYIIFIVITIIILIVVVIIIIICHCNQNACHQQHHCHHIHYHVRPTISLSHSSATLVSILVHGWWCCIVLAILV